MNKHFRTAVSKTRNQTEHGILQHWASPFPKDTNAEDSPSSSDSASEDAQAPMPKKKTRADVRGDSASKIGRSATSKRRLVDSDTEPAPRKRAAIQATNETSDSESDYVASSSDSSEEYSQVPDSDENHEQGSVNDQNDDPGTFNDDNDDKHTVNGQNDDPGMFNDENDGPDTGAAGESHQTGTVDSSQYDDSPRAAAYEEAARKNLGFLAMLLLERFRRLTKGHDPLADMSDREATNEILKNLASMNKHIIVSLIRNSLARDKVADENIKRITDDLYLRSAHRPACYLVSLVDDEGHPPTPTVLFDGIELVRLYCTHDLDAQESKIVMEMEHAIGNYSIPWTIDHLPRTFLRSYLNRPPPSRRN